MANLDAQEIAERLALRAEAFCRKYLSAGRKEGRYWMVGDVRNAPGKSTYVRLEGPPSGKGAAGKWTDAASGEYGNLLDILRESCGLPEFRAVLAEARSFLSLPDPEPIRNYPVTPVRTQSDNRATAQRLFSMSLTVRGSLAELYWHSRGLILPEDDTVLRFHPRCFYKAEDDEKPQNWPALIAAVTDLAGHVTGVHRTWLRRDGKDKAPLDPCRKAMGDVLGNAVRFGKADDVLAAGEGLETVRSLAGILPTLPTAAATSADHLAAIVFPDTLRRLYIVRDNDHAGDGACDTLAHRCQVAGIEAVVLWPQLNDFNDDLHELGQGAMRARLIEQVMPQDLWRFLVR